jgi:hypothetical protein
MPHLQPSRRVLTLVALTVSPGLLVLSYYMEGWAGVGAMLCVLGFVCCFALLLATLAAIVVPPKQPKRWKRP